MLRISAHEASILNLCKRFSLLLNHFERLLEVSISGRYISILLEMAQPGRARHRRGTEWAASSSRASVENPSCLSGEGLDGFWLSAYFPQSPTQGVSPGWSGHGSGCSDRPEEFASARRR